MPADKSAAIPDGRLERARAALATPLPGAPAAPQPPPESRPPPAQEAGVPAEASVPLEPEPDPEPPAPSPEPLLETARALLSELAFTVGVQPQERALAGYFLGAITCGLSSERAAQLFERAAGMDAPSIHLLEALIARPETDQVATLIERGRLEEGMLVDLAATGDAARLKAIARRRPLSMAVADALIARAEPDSLRLLLANTSATLTRRGVTQLMRVAAEQTTLQSAIAARPELQPDQGLDFFWQCPAKLRLFLVKRFLNTSARTDHILALGGVTAAPATGGAESFLARLESDQAEAEAELARSLTIRAATARRIMTDRQGDALIVALRVLGLGLRQLPEAIAHLARLGLISAQATEGDDLTTLFAVLSPAMARVAVIYWNAAGATTA